MSYEQSNKLQKFPSIQENSNQVPENWNKFFFLNFQPNLRRLFALEQADMCCLALQCMSIFSISITQIVSVVLVGQTLKVITVSFRDVRAASTVIPLHNVWHCSL